MLESQNLATLHLFGANENTQYEPINLVLSVTNKSSDGFAS